MYKKEEIMILEKEREQVIEYSLKLLSEGR